MIKAIIGVLLCLLAASAFAQSGSKSITFSLTVNPASTPTVKLDAGNYSVGAGILVTFSNGGGTGYDTTALLALCNGAAFSATTCGRPAGLSESYMNCTGSPPTTAITSGSCSTFVAPSANGTYYMAWFASSTFGNPNSYTAVASAQFTVGGGTTPTITGLTLSPNQFTIPNGQTTVGISGTLTTTCSVTPCPGAASFSLFVPPPPTITVNSGSGANVPAGSTMTVAVANGPGNTTDWMGICNAGVTPSKAQCDGAGYNWDYLNCTQTAPTTGLTAASCSLVAPSTAGNYVADFFSNGGYTALASASFTVTGTVGCTPAGSPCPIGGPTPPSGFHWNLTKDDEFTQDTSVNTSLWLPLNEAGGVYVQSTAGMSFSSANGIALQPCIDNTQTCATSRVLLTTQSTISGQNPPQTFAQRGGYWEWMAKYPTNVSGEGNGIHSDIWYRALNASGQEQATETDLCETQSSTTNQDYCYNYVNNQLPVSCVQCYAQNYPNNVVIGGGFHAYGMYWNITDGSSYGTESAWFDGTQQSSYTHTDPNWANPAIMVFSVDGCMGDNRILDNGTECSGSTSSNNPFYMKYVRVWQLQAN